MQSTYDSTLQLKTTVHIKVGTYVIQKCVLEKKIRYIVYDNIDFLTIPMRLLRLINYYIMKSDKNLFFSNYFLLKPSNVENYRLNGSMQSFPHYIF